MEIVLVRHALPLRVELETGIADPELAAEGHEQAAKMAAYLGIEDVEAIYVSPLRRALETARPLCEVLGLEAVVSEGVAEFDPTRASTYQWKSCGPPMIRVGKSCCVASGTEWTKIRRYLRRVWWQQLKT